MWSDAAIPDTPVRFLLHYMRRRPLQFGGLFLLILGAAGCAVAVQWGMKLLVDAMAATDRATADVWTPLTLFLGLILAENVLWRAGGWLGCRAVVASGIDIRLDLFRHLSGHSLRYFSQNMAGALGGRITATAGAIGSVLGTLTWSIMPPVIDFIGAVIVLTTVDGRMGLALVLFVAITGLSVLWYGSRGRGLHRLYAEEGARVGGELVDVVSNIWTVKAFSARQREHARLNQALGIEGRAQVRSWMHLEKTRVLHDLCLTVLAGAMLVWVVSLWQRGSVTPGDVVMVSALTFRILHGSRDLAFALVGITQQLGAVADTLRIIARPHDVPDRPDARPPAAAPRGEVRLERVTFAHAGRTSLFRDLDLHIPAGQRLGVVGASGAGKSTLLTLIQRLEDVQGGRVLIDGEPVTGLSQDGLRYRIAVVPQDVSLFHRSVLENIRYGRPDAPDADVHAAARAARCDDFVRSLPQGYDTLVGERGILLSGGQRQRIGIARAFLKDAPVLILDEATSALDTASEIEIQQALDGLMQGRTVVSVAHRLSTVAGFDRIIVLADGHIVEDGSPGDLIRRGGPFARMWQLQARSLPTAAE